MFNQTRFIHSLMRNAGLFALLNLVLIFPAAATTFTVTSIADSGTGSLREAIGFANANSDADVIVFNATLTGIILLTGGHIEITNPVTIGGSYATGLTVKGSSGNRVFKVSAGVAVSIKFLTLESIGSSTILGGIIYNNGGNLELANCIIESGQANQGAIYNANSGTLTLDQCTIQNNIAEFGAAIFNENGTATVRHCSITQNGTSLDGSSGSIKNGSSGTLNIISSTFAENRADIGAAITNYGGLTIKDSTFSKNETNSTTGNKQGGALYNANAATATIINSTFSNNIAYWLGGGIANFGNLTIKNSTLVENSADDFSNAKGGGIYNGSSGSLTIANSILSANRINSAHLSPEIYNGGILNSQSKNIFGLDGGIGIDGAPPTAGTYFTPAAGFLIGNIVNDLADNGGSTQTRAPVIGGLAHNTGDNASAIGLAFDQRGNQRIVGVAVDIGAVEISPLNDTGITSCSNETQNGLACPVTGFPGQDAEYGVNNGFNFTKISNSGAELPATASLGSGSGDWACTRDNVTGLMWEVKTDSGLRDQNSTYTWYDSTSTDGNLGTANGGVCNSAGHCDTEKYVNDVNATVLCGSNDWRMPNIKELTEIVDYGRSYPAIDPIYFPNTPSSWFWSGSPIAGNASSAWYVYFGNGNAYNGSRDDYSHVRLVRSGQSFDTFADNGDGTVSQMNTGLMWAKCSEGQTGTGCAGTATTMNWSTALTAANNSPLGGHSDWRLPNVKELQALVDHNLFAPAIDPIYFPNTPSSWFWSGSPYASDADYAWGVDFDYGVAGSNGRSNARLVRLVRGGQSFDTFDLTVTTTGSGAGSVTGSDGFIINCGATCFARLNTSTSIDLTATADTGYTFDSWSGDCSGAANTCAITMDAAKTVNANFTANSYSITATANPTAGGTVNCSPNPVTSGNTANCTATANAGYTFSTFSGDCTGSTCALTNVTADKTVTANFTATATYSITASATPSAGGTVSCAPNPVTSGNTANCTATANAGYTFSAFSGDCTGSTCALTNVTANKTVTASFMPIPITLTVTKTGAGAITSTPAGINCGADCSEDYALNTPVTLSIMPVDDYVFGGWTGPCVGAFSTCVVTMDAAKTVSAEFRPNLIVDPPPTTGTIASIGIDCGTDCRQDFALNTPVTLTATPKTGYVFGSWSGACSGTANTCTVTMDAVKTVTATFPATPVYHLSISTNGTGVGFVTSAPAGINCGATCAATFKRDTSVVLTTGVPMGAAFSTWGGACSGTAHTCTVNMTADQAVTATFVSAPITYKIAIDKIGSGTVTSNLAGIDCGSTCIASFDSNASLILTPTPATGETLMRWHGCAAVNAANECRVALNRNKVIRVIFSASVAPAVDVMVTAIALTPTTIQRGSTFTAAITVKNQGTITMNGGNLEVWVDLPTGKSCGATGNVSVDIGQLAVGESKTVTALLPPPLTAGTKRLRVFADSRCEAAEANEYNNQALEDYTVN